jgi:FMN reductase (NADPH)
VTDNPVIRALMAHRSIRKYTDAVPTDEVVETIVRAGQQAPFAYQMGSVLLSRKREHNPFHAPLLFTICVDAHRMELVMARRGWKLASNHLHVLLFGMEDAVMMAQNMVIAAESLGLGTCYLGAAQYRTDEIAKEYGLPERVFPVVGLAAGYPAEDPPPRPRYPLEFTLFEDRYPELEEAKVTRAMQAMDEGFLAQDYYRRANLILPLEAGREESFTFDNYSWTEHISRKLGQWSSSAEGLMQQLAARGFSLPAGVDKRQASGPEAKN